MSMLSAVICGEMAAERDGDTMRVIIYAAVSCAVSPYALARRYYALPPRATRSATTSPGVALIACRQRYRVLS